MLENRAVVRRWQQRAQLVVGLVLLVFGYYIGREHLNLIRGGARASGTIVGYKEEYMSNGSSARWEGAFMPIVKFQAGDQVTEFKDWLGSSVAAPRNAPVIVLYDPANPAVAMIDRPVWNWIPWAPTMAVGLFLTIVGLRALVSAARSA